MRETVAILGSGTMGCDVALLCARAGYEVCVWHRKDAGVAEARWTRRVASYVQREILTAAEAERMKLATHFTEELSVAAHARWIVESIAEDLGMKREWLARIDRLCAPDTILMSNTSCLPLDRLADDLTRPNWFAGVHFFNPALKIRLVEVAGATQTEAECLARIHQWVTSLGRSPVRVKATPGFVVNRLMAGLMAQAFRLLEAGTATAADIDRLACEVLGHPIGPLALGDLIGLDIAEAILARLSDDIPDPALRPCETLRSLVAAGHLGRKTGRGVHSYPGQSVS